MMTVINSAFRPVDGDTLPDMKYEIYTYFQLEEIMKRLPDPKEIQNELENNKEL